MPGQPNNDTISRREAITATLAALSATTVAETVSAQSAQAPAAESARPSFVPMSVAKLEHPRAGGPHVGRDNAASLGLLADLPGTWVGNGFNVISLPNRQPSVFRVKAGPTKEVLTFTAIGGKIPNRGSVQPDIFYLGLHYFQLVSDALTNEAMHIEPGLWLNMPLPDGTDDGKATHRLLVRQATIPHGDSLLALSSFLDDVKVPHIDDEDATPLKKNADGTAGAPVGPADSPYLQPFKDAVKTLPNTIDPAAIMNPNILLKNAIAAIPVEQILNTKVISITTDVPKTSAGILNVPFVTRNANAVKMTATLWIETIRTAGGDTFLQLQYTQRVLLDFAGILWPHISVATLIQQ